MATSALLAFLITSTAFVNAQTGNDTVPSSYPHVYPGAPEGDYSPAWQTYFEVVDSLPNVTWTLPRNWAGNIPVQRDSQPNDTLFFWAFEKEEGSLTANASERLDEPWGIWLNGGPGSSSMAGLMLENGPIHVSNDWSIYHNNYSWDKEIDYFWIDQPVGTGWSTASSNGYIADEDQMGLDFMGFLENLVKVFPSLARRPLYLTGESYAGTYIPYITKTYFGLIKPPVNLKKIAIGDGVLGSVAVFQQLPTVTTIETYPQLIDYDPVVYQYFKEQTHTCGYDLNLTYPQNGHFPSLNLTGQPYSTDFTSSRKSKYSRESFLAAATARLSKRTHSEGINQWKRDLSERINGSINPWYGCYLFDEMVDYAVNYTFPWNLGPEVTDGSFDVYSIIDALFPEAPQDASVFLNDNRTRSAIHAPTSKDWIMSINYPFGNVAGGQDPSVEPMAFLTDLATNATKNNITVIIYSGNDDSLVAHRGSEVSIQNTTFGGIQGFTRKPSTAWTDYEGKFCGIIHQERGWIWTLFDRAGHNVPLFQPYNALVFLKEFILGNNQTGLVTTASGTTTVIGGETPILAADYLRGIPEIYYGSGTTQSTYLAPTATVAKWNSFIATADPVPTQIPGSGN